MKQFSFVTATVCALASALSIGCASNAAPPTTAQGPGYACASPDAYVVSTDTITRGLAPHSFETPVVNVAPLYLDGRGVTRSSQGVPARTVANTEHGRGDSRFCY